MNPLSTVAALALFALITGPIAVYAEPSITRQPATITTTSGQPATFRVEGSGDGTLRWQ